MTSRGRGVVSTAIAIIAVLAAAAPANAGLLGGSSRAGDWTLGGVPCDLIPVPAANPIGTGACPGVRPGAVVESDAGQCTFNFLFQGSDGGATSAPRATASSASRPSAATSASRPGPPGPAPRRATATGNRIGEFAYAILQDPKDFALIRLDPGVEANAQMCHFGGPTGVNSDQGATPVVLHHFGQGRRGRDRAARSERARPRHAEARTTCTPGGGRAG